MIVAIACFIAVAALGAALIVVWIMAAVNVLKDMGR